MFSHKLADETELRLIEPRHAEELYELIDHDRERLRTWLIFVERAVSLDAERIFAKSGLKQFADGRGFHCGVVYKGRLAGGVGILPIDQKNRSTEIGYWLGEEAEGKGLITASCRALLDHCFGEMGINRVTFRAAPGNERSLAVIGRLGAKHEGTQRQSVILQGQPTDQEVFSIIKNEWPVNPARGRSFFTCKLDDETQLELREPTHAEETYTLIDANREHLRRWLYWVDGTKSPEDIKAFISRQLHQRAENGTTVAGIRHCGALAGIISLNFVSPGCMDIGYWLGEDFQGKGLITKTCKAMISHAFDDLGVRRIEIRVQPANERSRAVPERLGFTCEGTLRQKAIDADGKPVDFMMYSLLKSEWDDDKNCGKFGGAYGSEGVFTSG